MNLTIMFPYHSTFVHLLSCFTSGYKFHNILLFISIVQFFSVYTGRNTGYFWILTITTVLWWTCLDVSPDVYVQKVSQNISLGIESVGHLTISSTFLDFAELFPTVVLPGYTPTSSIEYFLFSIFCQYFILLEFKMFPL